MSGPVMYAPDYLRAQKDEQLHSIAKMIEEQCDTLADQRIKIQTMYNALQSITESGVVDCLECQGHERIAKAALSDVEKRE